MRIVVNCKNCGVGFYARKADVNRGWGIFCCKSCKAQHQIKTKKQKNKNVINSNIKNSSWDDHLIQLLERKERIYNNYGNNDDDDFVDDEDGDDDIYTPDKDW